MTIALVTGTSTGIGYATALRLARDGHHVVASMRDPAGSDLPERAAAEGLSLEVMALDVEGPDVEDRLDDVMARLGGVDVLVNNAGIGGGGVVETAEVAPFGIRVVSVEPGAIMTAIWSKVDMAPPTGPYAPIICRLTSPDSQTDRCERRMELRGARRHSDGRSPAQRTSSTSAIDAIWGAPGPARIPGRIRG